MEVWLSAALDRLGEPPNRLHPVAWFGGLARRLEARFYRDSVLAGGALALLLVALAGALGYRLERALAGLPPGLRYPLFALCLKPSFALFALLAAVAEVERALQKNLAAGRLAVARIVSRDAKRLDPPQVRMAALSSLAENLVDSVVAPLFYYLLFGLPGAYVYRAVNTLDALWGYPNVRYRSFGRVAARLDDALNYLPARLVGVWLLGRGGPGFRALLGEAEKTPSPNAGWPMAALALRLGVRLEKPGVYVLNPGGREPGAGDLRRGLAAARLFGYLWVFVAGAVRMGVAG